MYIRVYSDKKVNFILNTNTFVRMSRVGEWGEGYIYIERERKQTNRGKKRDRNGGTEKRQTDK